jgi:hypothetical protein
LTFNQSTFIERIQHNILTTLQEHYVEIEIYRHFEESYKIIIKRMSSISHPRRAAAQIAEVLNRAELEANPDIGGSDDEDEEYQSSEHENPDDDDEEEKEDKQRRKRARIENIKLKADEEANRVYNELKRIENVPNPDILKILKQSNNINVDLMFAHWQQNHQQQVSNSNNNIDPVVQTSRHGVDNSYTFLRRHVQQLSNNHSNVTTNNKFQDASSLLDHLKQSTKQTILTQTRDGTKIQSTAHSTSNNDDSNALTPLQLAQNVMQTTGLVSITESVKFAGEMVTVTKQVDKTSLEGMKALNPPTILLEKTGLDAMVEGIMKKKGISAVEKSTFDWEKYKQEKQLNEELKDASRDGYVEKQQFLNRIDERQFELERAERERARIKRELAKAGGGNTTTTMTGGG